MASKSYTLLEYLVTIETELKKLKKIVAESVGADYSELIAQINGIGNELNSFKTSITNTVDNNNTNLLSKFNSLEQQFNTFKTSITNTVNSNKSEITSQVNTLTTNFNSFKTSLESQVSGLTTRMTNVERRVTTLENSGGSSGGSVDLTEVNSRISTNENNILTLQSDVSSLKGRVSSLENNQGSSGGSIGGTSKTLIHDYTVTEGTILNITNLETSTGQFTTDSDIDLSKVTGNATPVKKEGVYYLIGSDIPSALQNASNIKLIDVIDKSFKLKGFNSYDITGNFDKYGILVNGIINYQVKNIFKANKNYEIEIYTAQPSYNTGIALSSSVNNFNYLNGYAIGVEQYSTYLNCFPLPNREGINTVKHLIKLYNYTNSFKLEIESLFDGLNSNTVKYNYIKYEYIYNGNIMVTFDYCHFRNLISKGTTIKIYDLGGN